MLSRWHPVFEHVPFESIIHSRQEGYYRVLGLSDRAGNSAPFVEFALEALRDALADLMSNLRAERSTLAARLEIARQAFGRKEFSRKEYLALLKNVSTATASRDLSSGVKQEQLVKRGTKALARYRFHRRTPLCPSTPRKHSSGRS